jgi:hypothetical protein
MIHENHNLTTGYTLNQCCPKEHGFPLRGPVSKATGPRVKG